MHLVAAVDVEEGEEITLGYVPNLQSTPHRQVGTAQVSSGKEQTTSSSHR